jgi:predicted secreted protein
MHWLTGVLVYFVIWWVTLFAVLPWGARPPENPEAGHADSAPERPRLMLKFTITTGIAGLLWLVYYAVHSAGLINFRVPA